MRRRRWRPTHSEKQAITASTHEMQSYNAELWLAYISSIVFVLVLLSRERWGIRASLWVFLPFSLCVHILLPSSLAHDEDQNDTSSRAKMDKNGMNSTTKKPLLLTRFIQTFLSILQCENAFRAYKKVRRRKSRVRSESIIRRPRKN